MPRMHLIAIMRRRVLENDMHGDIEVVHVDRAGVLLRERTD